MRQQGCNTEGTRAGGAGRHPRRAQIAVSLCLLLSLCLLSATPAAASFEALSAFGSNDVPPVHTPSGIAVNYTGAGGVPVGTVYVIGERPGGRPGVSVMSYDATGKFRQAWGWGVADDNKEFERCGPDGEPAHPSCKDNGNIEYRYGYYGEGAGELTEPRGIAVDQATGYVYVDNSSPSGGRKHGAVQIFTAAGEPVGGFGEQAEPGEPIPVSPSKFHQPLPVGRIAVDASGTVYVGDYSIEGDSASETRVMVFKPESPGDYAHYVYTGRENDIGFSLGGVYTTGGVTIDEAGNLYLHTTEFISEFPPGEKNTPSCRYKVPGGGIEEVTVNPKSGDVFYTKEVGGGKIRQLAACNAQGEFKEKSSFLPAVAPAPTFQRPLAFDPALSYEASRPAGIFYVGNLQNIEVFVPAEIRPPRVESESVTSVGAASASLHAQINPEGSQTNYAFQYLTQAAYEANKADEIQSLTLSATGGVFGPGLQGRRYGGEGEVTLSSGSATASALKTASGTATLKGAAGTATLSAAKGTGTVIAGSTAVTALTTAEGAFEVGQQISGTGIPQGTTIKAVKAGELTLSAPAIFSSANTPLGAGSTTLSSLTTSEGTFEVGETVSGEGIPGETTITATKAGQLTISKPPTKAGTGVSIKAGSKQLTSVTTGSGHFEAGQRIEGTGIPAETTIEAVEGAKLTLSKAITTPGTGVAISTSGPGPFAVGQRIEGAGIPANTTITALKAGELTLSAPATASGTVTVHAGLPFDAKAGEVRQALESLPTIGSGNVSVSGGPGDEAGSNPYRVQFSGDLTNTDLPLLEADSSGLSGGSASATVGGENDGGGGFAGASETPAGGAVLGSGQQPLSAGASVGGLQPDTTYYYRATASSPCNPEDEGTLCKASGAAQRFHTFPLEAPELPDHRVYELVSPVQKAGGEVFRLEPSRSSCYECNTVETRTFPKQSSPDGEAVVYEGQPFVTSGGGRKENEYLAHRTPSGWQTTNLTPELLNTGAGEIGFKAFDPNFDKGLLAHREPSLSSEAPSEFANLYGFSSADPAALSPLIAAEPPNRSSNGFALVYAGATPDLSHALFEANDALTGETSFAPEAVDGGLNKNNLYESVNGELRLVNVLPDGETLPGASFGSGTLLRSGEDAFDNAISTDGSRIFWSDESGQLYLREDGERTREVSDHTGKFLTATPDGSEVLLSDGHLIGIGDEEPVTDLTEGKGGFLGIAGRSEDLSAIYFVDTAVLGGEENERGEVAQAGSPNLYLHRDGTTTFIATLEKQVPQGSPGDDHIDSPQVNTTVGDWHPAAGRRSAEASPDGRYLAFMSRAPLSGVDSTGNCVPTTVGSGENAKHIRVTGPCEEVFLYDSRTGRLSCPSCNPAGRAPLGNSALPLNNPGTNPFQPQQRFVTDSGRLYFDSQDSLSTFDTNEGFEDVYQHEPEGVGSCEKAGGCVKLISAGTEPVDSNFHAIDESGMNVFFTTRDQLSLKDHDDLIDLYDAREDGGIASETETSRGECQGEACQAPVSAPNDPTPGSSTFEGAGNVNEAKAKKHAKKHKKKKHAKKKHAHKRAAKRNRGGVK
jgi:hypothetical protein